MRILQKFLYPPLHICISLLFIAILYVQVSSYPGQDVPIRLKAYDELNHTSAAIFRIGLNENKVIMSYIT